MKKLTFLLPVFISVNMIAQNVGINTTIPNRLFTVKSAGIGITQQSSDASTEIGFYTANGLAFLQTNTNHPLYFATNNGVAQMALSTVGNLGIGITVPAYKLDVNGTAHVNGAFKLTDGTQANNRVLTSDANGNATWQAAAYANTERFSFQNFYSTSGGASFTTFYNYGTATAHNSITGLEIFETAISFTKTGLYHFSVHADANITCAEIYGGMLIRIDEGGSPLKRYVEATIPSTPYTTGVITATYDKEIDIYIDSPKTMNFYGNYNLGGATRTTNRFALTVTGNLITD